jgi:hypothetical protein
MVEWEHLVSERSFEFDHGTAFRKKNEVSIFISDSLKVTLYLLLQILFLVSHCFLWTSCVAGFKEIEKTWVQGPEGSCHVTLFDVFLVLIISSNN